jgi:hypothetical protein
LAAASSAVGAKEACPNPRPDACARHPYRAIAVASWTDEGRGRCAAALGARRVEIMDIRAEARRLASIATVFVWVGWFFVFYAIISGVFWWIDLAQSAQFNFLESLGLSLAAIGGPIFLALIVAGMGHFLRLFALWAARESNV